MPAYITDSAGGWVSVAPKDTIKLDIHRAARALSESLDALVLGVRVYDGDDCWVSAFRAGKRVVRITHGSIHSETADLKTIEAGGEMLKNGDDRTKIEGKLAVLAKHLAVDVDSLRRAVDPKRACAEDIPASVAKLCGIAEERMMFSYPWRLKGASIPAGAIHAE